MAEGNTDNSRKIPWTEIIFAVGTVVASAAAIAIMIRTMGKKSRKTITVINPAIVPQANPPETSEEQNTTTIHYDNEFIMKLAKEMSLLSKHRACVELCFKALSNPEFSVSEMDEFRSLLIHELEILGEFNGLCMLLQQHPEHENVVGVQMSLAEYQKLLHNEKCLEHLARAEELASAENMSFELARIYAERAEYYELIESYEVAEKCYRKFLQFLFDSSLSEKVLVLLNQQYLVRIVGLYLAQKKYDQAIAFEKEEAGKIIPEGKYYFYLYELAQTFLMHGYTEKAESLFKEIIVAYEGKFREYPNELGAETGILIMNTQQSLGVLYYNQGKPELYFNSDANIFGKSSLKTRSKYFETKVAGISFCREDSFVMVEFFIELCLLRLKKTSKITALNFRVENDNGESLVECSTPIQQRPVQLLLSPPLKSMDIGNYLMIIEVLLENEEPYYHLQPYVNERCQFPPFSTLEDIRNQENAEEIYGSLIFSLA